MVYSVRDPWFTVNRLNLFGQHSSPGFGRIVSVAVSVFDIFKVGIGPSSSHTVGPMRAARIFVTDLAQSPVWPEVTRVRAELFGSLGATGHGHGSEAAVLLGLEGEDPATVDTDQTPARAASIANDGRITLDAVHGGREISFDVTTDLVLHRNRSLPFHPNGMTFTCLLYTSPSPRDS